MMSYWLNRQPPVVTLPINVPKDPIKLQINPLRLTFKLNLPTLKFTLKKDNMSAESITFGDEITRSIDLLPLLEELGITIADITNCRLSFNTGSDSDTSVLVKSITGNSLSIDTEDSLLLVPFVANDYNFLQAKDSYNLELKIFFSNGSPTANGGTLYIEPQKVPNP